MDGGSGTLMYICTDSFHHIVSYLLSVCPPGQMGDSQKGFTLFSLPTTGRFSLPPINEHRGRSLRGSQWGLFAATRKDGWLHNHDTTHISLALAKGIDCFPLRSHRGLGGSETGTGTKVGTHAPGTSTGGIATGGLEWTRAFEPRMYKASLLRT